MCQNKKGGGGIVQQGPGWSMSVQRVIAGGTGDDCSVEAASSRWKQQTGEHAGGGAGVEVVHPLERTLDGWGAGMPDSLQEIESNSLSAKVAETNGWDRGWVTLLWTPRHWCFSGRLAFPGVVGDLTIWLFGSRWGRIEAYSLRRIKPSQGKGKKAQTEPRWSTMDVFIIKTISWQWLWGECFIFSLGQKSILKQCSHVFKEKNKLPLKTRNRTRKVPGGTRWPHFIGN